MENGNRSFESKFNRENQAVFDTIAQKKNLKKSVKQADIIRGFVSDFDFVSEAKFLKFIRNNFTGIYLL